MKYSVLFLLVGLLLGTLACRNQGRSLLLLWPGVSFTLVGMAYGGLGARVFGKRPDGTLDPLRAGILLPYLAITWIVWRGLRWVRRGEDFGPLVEGVFIGRRLLAGEYPPGIASVVDLTCEFPEPKGVRDGRVYRSLPVLDASGTSLETLRNLVTEISRMRREVYIHCAEGHGRTAMVAVAFLLHSGAASSPEEAMDLVLQARPKARLSPAQRRVVESFARELSLPVAPDRV